MRPINNHQTIWERRFNSNFPAHSSLQVYKDLWIVIGMDTRVNDSPELGEVIDRHIGFSHYQNMINTNLQFQKADAISLAKAILQHYGESFIPS